MLAAAVLAVLGWVALDRARQSWLPPPATPAPAAPTPPTPTTLAVATRLPGKPPAGPVATLLVVAALSPPRVVDVARGTARPIRGLPTVDGSAYTVADVGDRVLITARPPFSGRTTREPGTNAYVVDVATASATRIASGDGIAAGASGASILVSRRRADGREVARRYDLAGRPQGALTTLPAGRSLVRETAAGWLLAGTVGGDQRWELWDARTGAIRGTYAQLFAVSATRIAYGNFDRTVRISDLVAGALGATRLPETVGDISDARFSQDGRYLALDNMKQDDRVHSVWALDTTTMTWTRLPGTPVRVNEAIRMSWSDSALVLATDVPAPAVSVWRLGTPEVYAIRP